LATEYSRSDTPPTFGRRGDIYYVHVDHLHTPREVTRPTDNVLMWAWFSDPFGTNAADENPAGASSFKYNLRFSGQMFDGQAGLHQNFHRDLDPATGRFIEADPVGFAVSVGSCAYAFSSPVAAPNSATHAPNCPNDDECKQLNKNVQDAKKQVGAIGKCLTGMSPAQLEDRYYAWLNLATARSIRDEKCWNGGDDGHQNEQAVAWSKVGERARYLGR
jgi:RHS repeat-associated protein